MFLLKVQHLLNLRESEKMQRKERASTKSENGIEKLRLYFRAAAEVNVQLSAS